MASSTIMIMPPLMTKSLQPSKLEVRQRTNLQQITASAQKQKGFRVQILATDMPCLISSNGQTAAARYTLQKRALDAAAYFARLSRCRRGSAAAEAGSVMETA